MRTHPLLSRLADKGSIIPSQVPLSHESVIPRVLRQALAILSSLARASQAVPHHNSRRVCLSRDNSSNSKKTPKRKKKRELRRRSRARLPKTKKKKMPLTLKWPEEALQTLKSLK